MMMMMMMMVMMILTTMMMMIMMIMMMMIFTYCDIIDGAIDRLCLLEHKFIINTMKPPLLPDTNQSPVIMYYMSVSVK